MKWSDITCPDRTYGPFNENEKAVRGFFLHSIGVDLENIPDELFEPCLLLNHKPKNVTAEYEAKIHISNIVGTTHSCYGGKTWVDALLQQHKALHHITQGHVTKNKYFHMLKQHVSNPHSSVHLIKTKDGSYYINKNGNHRITFYKLMYLADIAQAGNNSHLFWLYALVQDEE